MLIFQKKTGDNYAAPESSVADGVCKISFTPSPHGGIAKMWFRCSIRNDGTEILPERSRIRLKNIQGMLGGGDGVFRPVFRYGNDSGFWKRFPQGKRIVSPDGRIHLEWELATPSSGEFLELAFSYPYELDDWNRMISETNGYWQSDEIGVTGEDGILRRFSNQYGDSAAPRRGIYLLARQHAGEVSGSWVLDGLLRRIAERNVKFPVWCVPFVDLDGVLAGNYGKDSYPHDMNRAWGPYEFMRHETKVIGGDLAIWGKRVIPEESLVLDFHAPGAEEKGVYAFLSPEAEKLKPAWKTKELLNRIGIALHPYSQDPFIKTGGYKKYSAWGNFSSLEEYCLWSSVPLPFASMEISYFEAGGEVLTPELYRKLGARIADELCRTEE